MNVTNAPIVASDSKSGVAFLTPSFAPRVAHDPVFLATFFAPANNGDLMSTTLQAMLRVKDTSPVVEEFVIHNDLHSNRTIKQFFFVSVRITLGAKAHSLRFNVSVGLAVVFASVAFVCPSTGVRVVVCLNQEVVFEITISNGSHAAGLARIAVRLVFECAVDKLLLRESHNFSWFAGVNVVTRLQRNDGTEGPARATPCLVLNRSDTAVAPIHRLVIAV